MERTVEIPDLLYEYLKKLDYDSLKNFCLQNRQFRDICTSPRFNKLVKDAYQSEDFKIRRLQMQLVKLKRDQTLVAQINPHHTIRFRWDDIHEKTTRGKEPFLLDMLMDFLEDKTVSPLVLNMAGLRPARTILGSGLLNDEMQNAQNLVSNRSEANTLGKVNFITHDITRRVLIDNGIYLTHNKDINAFHKRLNSVNVTIERPPKFIVDRYLEMIALSPLVKITIQ